MKQMTRLVPCALVILAAISLMTGVAPAHAKTTIIFADFGWDSAQVHNRIAGIIIEKGLGYPIKFVQGETIMLNTALIQAKGGEAPNVNMETWTENWLPVALCAIGATIATPRATPARPASISASFPMLDGQ